MGDVVDFNKAKKEADKKQNDKTSQKAKNQRLAQKMKRYDNRIKFKALYFYLAILAIITVSTFIFSRI